MVLLGLPLSWHKVSGGTEVSWVGYRIHLRERELGVSASRSEWLIKWMESLIANKVADTQALAEGLGRACF
eukprot:3091450-Alexandrium_andersonii.AAC.1